MKEINYSEIDVEVRELCKALNQIHGINTVESCFGHGEDNIYIWLKCYSIELLNHFMWAMCHRWANISCRPDSDWTIQINNADTDRDANFLSLLLIGKNGLTQKDCDKLASQITKWVEK